MRRLTLLLVLALAAPAHALTLTTPAGTVAGHPLGTMVAADVEVSGRAPRGALVAISTACRPTACATTTVADRHGRWATELDVVVPPARRTLRLHVRTATKALARTVALTSVPNTVAGPDLEVIGDSLTVGTEPPLRALMPDWRVTVDAYPGRSLQRGMDILARAPGRPDVLAMALFTNNDPRDVDLLEAAVEQSLTRAPCVLWATIVRPPARGVTARLANRRLKALARADGRLRIVDWSAAVHRHPEWLVSDHVHATPEGYAARAQLFADAARGCLSDL